MKKILASVVAVVMLIAGVLATGCSDGLVEQAAPDMIELYLWSRTIDLPNNTISAKSENENVAFVCTAEAGSFIGYDEGNPKQITLSPNEETHWDDRDLTSVVEHFFIDIVAEEDSHIVGYAVIEVRFWDFYGNYTPRVAESVLFPKVDGEYQTVTRKQVDNRIQNVKKENANKGKLTGAFVSLETALEYRYITHEDLLSIAYYHNGGRTGNEELMPEDFAPAPKDPEALDDYYEGIIKRDAAYEMAFYRVHEEAAEEDFTISAYYGEYGFGRAGKSFAFLMTDIYTEYPKAEQTQTVDGVRFFYQDANRIKIRILHG